MVIAPLRWVQAAAVAALIVYLVWTWHRWEHRHVVG